MATKQHVAATVASTGLLPEAGPISSAMRTSTSSQTTSAARGSTMDARISSMAASSSSDGWAKASMASTKRSSSGTSSTVSTSPWSWSASEGRSTSLHVVDTRSSRCSKRV